MAIDRKHFLPPQTLTLVTEPPRGAGERIKLKNGVYEKKRAKNRICGDGVPQCMRHLFIAAPLHSDERYNDERGRDHPDPHHVGRLSAP
jgi:hypothetical protein